MEKIFINIMLNKVNISNMDSDTFNTTHGGGCYLRSIVNRKEISI